MSQNIHSTAMISDEVEIGQNVEIGPYAIIEGPVKIADDCKIKSHSIIKGRVELGRNTTVFQFCSIGEVPQDLTYKGEDTRVIIGENNIFREYVSVHRGTPKDKLVTTIGNDNLFMAHSHVGHDAVVGNNCVIVNSVNLAGHVNVGDRTIIGGGSNISQFVTLGRGSYVGGASGVNRDIPPFCTAYGNRVKLKGINIIGLRRQGHSKQVISEVVDFYRTMESSAYSPRAFVSHDELMTDYRNNDVISELVEIIKNSEIGIAPFMS